MKAVPYLLIAAAALGLAGTAGAKGMAPERVCGESACVQLDGHGRPASVIVIDGNAARPAPAGGDYYRLDYSIDGSGPPYDFSHLFVPSGNLIGVDTEAAGRVRWFALYGGELDRLREATSELEPFQAPERWPASIGTAIIPAADGEGRDWTPYVFAAGLLTLAGFALVARRLRIRRPSTA